ncbi:MAG: amidohydrolase family protein, partial [Bacteroidales bacterium]
KNDGIARGTSALVTLTDEKANRTVLNEKAAVHYSFARGSSEDSYPTAQYGAIALLRQFHLDADWYSGLPDGYFYDASLEALLNNSTLPKIFEVRNGYEVLRSDAIGDEFGVKYIVKGGGDEYQLLDEIKKAGVSMIIPLRFPEAPDVKDPYEAAGVALSQLKHWEMAPSNAAMVSRAGINFALTPDGLSKPEDFLPALRKAVENGLDKKSALRAVTAVPAEMVGAQTQIGALRKGMIANLLVTSGDILDKDCVIYQNWVQGKPFTISDPAITDIRGDYNLTVGGQDYALRIAGKPEQPSVTVKKGEDDVKASITWKNNLLGMSLTSNDGILSLSGAYYAGVLKGDAMLAEGDYDTWKAVPAKETESETDTATAVRQGKEDNGRSGSKTTPADMRIMYPFTSYGWYEKPEQEDILFKNATIWTLDSQGRIEGADLLIKDGKIHSVGKNLQAAGARVIDATGMHISPGIIDEHSHIAMDASNETGQAITSEVRVGDIIDPADLSIYRQLSGGVTAAHLLHGSANPIGGQSVIIKHRWGLPASELKIDGQVGFLKHALGENVKRSTSRYPNTRMGTEHIIRDSYQRALDYRGEWERYNALNEKKKSAAIPPRRDLELDALVDVLEERSFITCHTYVQSEGMMIMKLAEDFGIKAHTLIHFNEGFKIADKMREHGAAGSVFSDWWNYKYEVYEGITYNAATLVQQGVLTCIHSDNAEMARRLNQEAGKIVKYGGVDPVEALKLVTLNPAKILHLDHRMGSIEPGKDADVVLWNGNPLSIYSRVKMTLVDGTVWFDEEKDAAMKKEIDSERNRLIQKILGESGSSRPAAGMPAQKGL